MLDVQSCSDSIPSRNRAAIKTGSTTKPDAKAVHAWQNAASCSAIEKPRLLRIGDVAPYHYAWTSKQPINPTLGRNQGPQFWAPWKSTFETSNGTAGAKKRHKHKATPHQFRSAK